MLGGRWGMGGGGGIRGKLYVIIVSKSVRAKMPHKEENPIIRCNKYKEILGTNIQGLSRTVSLLK